MSDTPAVVMNDETHRFEISLDGETAFAEYRLLGDHITLPHTVVPAALEGRGYASALAKAALGYARTHDLKVIPTCEFMAGYIKKHPEWQDLVHESYRAKLGLD